jgi:hypothetical protein
MQDARRSFGKKSDGHHATIRLPCAPRIFCVVSDRTDNTLYLELTEAKSLPFRFQMSMDSSPLVFNCEIKSQRGSKIVATYQTSDSACPGAGEQLFQRRASSPAESASTLDDLKAWTGFRPSRGFKS